MINSESVIIARAEGVTIYGKVINAQGKVGKYEVVAEHSRNEGTIYHSYADAEKRMAALIGVRSN